MPGDIISSFDLSQMERAFANKLSAIRKQEGLSVAGMADRLGVLATYIADWESGVSYPRLVIIRRICEKFSVTPNELYFDQACSEQQLSEDERDLTNHLR